VRITDDPFGEECLVSMGVHGFGRGQDLHGAGLVPAVAPVMHDVGDRRVGRDQCTGDVKVVQQRFDLRNLGLDEAQLRTIVRVLHNEPALAPVWNWQKRGVPPTAQT
jgi:hypothetical protein